MLDKFVLPPFMQWIVELVAFLVIVEKIGKFFVWLNDDEQDRTMVAVWKGFLKSLEGMWICVKALISGLEAIGEALNTAWSCVISWINWIIERT